MFRNIAKFLRARLRRWLGVIDPAQPPETVEDHAKREGISIAAAVLARAGEKQIQRKFKAPDLFPGVVPANYKHLATDDVGALGDYLAMDSAEVLDTFTYANNFNAGLGFPGYAYLAELSQRSEYRAPSETIAAEMTREWIKLTVKGKARRKDRKATANDASIANEADDGLEDKLEKIEEALEEFKVREAFRKCAELDGLFGRAQIFIDLDLKGRSDEVRQLPLIIDSKTIPKGSLKSFKVIEPIWTTPYSYNATDPTADDFYKPRAWFILGKRVHASRLLTFIMREVPDMMKPAYNFSGISMTQLMEPCIYQWLRTRNSVSNLIHNFSVLVLKTNIANVLAGDVGAGLGLLDRIKLFIANRDNQGLTVIDKTDEEMEAINVPLGGLEGLLSQAQRMQSAPSHIPLVKLVGEAASGLNASDEGAIKVFYDFVRACQEQFFGPHLKTVIEIVQLHLFGKIDDAISFEFVPLSAPTIKELADIRKSNAETDATYIDKGVVSPEEVRERVNGDPESGYNNLSGDAPEPPSLEEMGAQHELGEESAENAHKRNLEMQKNETAPKKD